MLVLTFIAFYKPSTPFGSHTLDAQGYRIFNYSP